MKLSKLSLASVLLFLFTSPLVAAPEVGAWREELTAIDKAAGVGDARAQGILSLLILFKEVKESEEQTQLALAKKSAASGSPFGHFSLGLAYAKGIEVEQDGEKAENFYRKALEGFLKAAGAGDVWAMFWTGICFQAGFTGEKNPREGAKWLQKAADQGNAMAQSYLATAYMEGRGVQEDLVEGVKWLRIAANRGLAEAQLNLGQAYKLGMGVQRDPVEAMKWIRKAADQGNESALRLIASIEPEQRLAAQVEALKAKSRKVASRTVDSGAGRDGGPQTEDILVAVNAYAFAEEQVVIKRGDVLISQGGRIPSGTRVFPIKVSGRISGGDISFDAVLTYRFWKDEFGDWEYEQIKK
jgi:TPR repeat protein